ncbi:PREDICTED: transcription factor EC-like, partial [Eurypyga helias]|uniref:transcription factor EC-like n=1 Tax=Eurypyga helias TaxID=54383 RepID=UPI000528D86B
IPHARRKFSPRREFMGCCQEKVLSSHLSKKYRERQEEAEGLPRDDSGVMRRTGSALGSHSHTALVFLTSDMRWNKGTILKASVEYIKWLQKEQQRARELEHRQKKLEHANRRLLLRIQELEIQARAHGLPVMSSLSAVNLAAQVIKQQSYPEENSVDYSQQMPLAHGPNSDVCDGSTAFSDPLSHFTDLSFSAALKEEQRLEEILLDDTVSPFGTDPLLSSTSPAASKESSRRSSFSTDDGDDL